MFAMHIWHIEEAIFVLSGGVLRNRDGKCREAATLPLLWGSVVASICCWFLCIYLRSDCGHHHGKTSLFLAVSFSQLPSYFICPYPWEIPFPMQGMRKKPRSPPLSCSHEDMSSSCAAFLPSEEGSLLLCVSLPDRVWGGAQQRILRGIPLASFLFSNLEAGGTKQKMLAYTWKRRSVGSFVVFWMIDIFLMLEVL